MIANKDTFPIGHRCLIRCDRAGVHIGDVVSRNGMECLLENAMRLWKWEGGCLSLSCVARKGLSKGSYLDRTGTIFLTECIEFIPTTKQAEETFVQYLIP